MRRKRTENKGKDISNNKGLKEEKRKKDESLIAIEK